MRTTEGLTACHAAVKNGRLEALNLLINLKADFKLKTNENSDLLHFACLYDHIDIIEYLIAELNFVS